MIHERMDERDAAILAERYALYNEEPGPSVGEYVRMPDGSLQRFSHDWDDSIQTAYGGSYYLFEGHASMSGALERAIPKADIFATDEKKMGSFWFFSHDYHTAFNGIDVKMPCRVWSYRPREAR